MTNVVLYILWFACTHLITHGYSDPTSDCVCGFVGQVFIQSFDREVYKFGPAASGNSLILYKGDLGDGSVKLNLGVNVSLPRKGGSSAEMMWVDYSLQITLKVDIRETRLVLWHHNFNAYPFEYNGQPNLLPYVDFKGLVNVFPLGLLTNYGQGSKVFIYQPDSKTVVAEIEIEPVYGNVYLIVKKKSDAGTNKGLCGTCSGSSTQGKGQMAKQMDASASELKVEKVNFGNNGQCGKDNAYCKTLCDAEFLAQCKDCNNWYQVCKSSLTSRQLHACALIQHIVADVKRLKNKILTGWQSKAFCFSEDKKSDYAGCKSSLGSMAVYMDQTPEQYQGCRAPASKLGPLTAALGAGCYCKASAYEYTSDKPYCFDSKDKCKCATTIERSGEWYLLETTQMYMTTSCKHKCECKTKNDKDEEYYFFQCKAYTMPTGGACITQAEARTKTSFASDFKGCVKKSIDANRYQFNLSSTQQVWCQLGYRGCPMFDDTCADVDECTMMDPLDRSYRPALRECVNADCKNTEGGYECTCKSNYKPDPDDKYKCLMDKKSMTKLTDKPAKARENQCEKNVCSEHADCTVDWRRICNVSCACRLGFSSGNTGFQCDRMCPQSHERFCTKSESQLKNMKCILDENDTPICVCGTGFQMDAAVKKCVDIDECAECKHQCVIHSTCTNTIGFYECKCDAGFYGNPVDECKDIDECDTGSAECDTNADCINTVPDYNCKCKKGWRGKKGCQGTPKDPCVDTDECEKPTTCGEYTTCKNTPGSFNCDCIAGGYRRHCPKSCEDINECVEIHYQKPKCHKFADCKNKPGNYTCKCKMGFIGDGFNCEADNSICEQCHKKSTVCELSPDLSRYLCKCKPGFLQMPLSDTQCQPEAKCEDPTKNKCDRANGICFDDQDSELGYKCKCKGGYTGNGKSCTPLDPCHSSPCKSVPHSVCKQTYSGTFTCDCETDYIKKNDDCIVDPRNIQSHNCSQCDPIKQECIKNPKQPDHWKCVCKDGYCLLPQGFYCSDCDECDTMSDNDCDNERAICLNRVPHLNNGLKYECKCKRGFEGNGKHDQCTDIDECKTLSTPCPNPHTKCLNTVGSYMCECDSRWEPLVPNMPQPVACKDIDECALGKHNFKVNCYCVNTEGSYTYAPLPGFKMVDDKCVDVDECVDDSGQPSKVCNPQQSTCQNIPGSYFCDCKEGFKRTPNGRCIDPDFCALGTHTCNLERENCVKTPGLYACPCKAGFSRKSDTDQCEDVNECQNTTSPCPQYSECFNVIGSFFCKCRKGFVVSDDSDPIRPQCTPINICEKNPKICGLGTCQTTESDPFYKCVCASTAIQMNATFCVSEYYCNEPDYPCPSNTSQCQEGKCECSKGHSWNGLTEYTTDAFKARKGCTPLNPCVGRNNPCSYGQTCVYLGPGQSKCLCPTGFQLVDKTCADIQECLNKSISTICPNNSECLNTIGSYKCVCKKGYVNVNPNLTPPECTDDNECLNPLKQFCGYHQHCVNDPGSYHCECDAGYEAVSTQPLECRDIDECRPGGTANCDPNAVCINTVGSHYCDCKTGFKGSGKVCIDIDECNPDRPLVYCGPFETCKNLIGSYECACQPGYEKTSKGSCTNIDECVTGQNNCSSFGVAVKKICDDRVPGFVCQCPMGYEWSQSSSNCIDKDECKDPRENNCTAYNADCKNLVPGFECACRNGFVKEHECALSSFCYCKNQDECKNSSACAPFSVCMDTTPGYNCYCNPGYVGDGYKECRPFNECIALTNKCGDNQHCTTVGGGPTCVCKDAIKFLPNFDNTKCLPNPCSIENGGCKHPAQCVPEYKNDKYEAKCACPKNYKEGRSPGNCEPINGCCCEDGGKQCISTKCPSNSECHNTAPNQFTCMCKRGYVKKDESCVDDDECQRNPCSAGATCKNSIGSFECICPLGQIVNNLNRCSPDIDCSRQQNCEQIDNTVCARVDDQSYLCKCKPGYIGDPAVACRRELICATKKDICKENEICIDTMFSYRCDCTPGYVKDESNKCVNDDECKRPNICPPRRTCVDTVGSYVCNCSVGFKMINDDCIDVDECADKLDNCNKIREKCTNYIPGFACNCKYPQYISINGGKCENNDECKTGMHDCPRYSTCFDTEGSFNCSCLKNFKAVMNENGKVVECADEDECHPSYTPKVCDMNAQCKNMFGGYYCRCNVGFYGSGVPNDCYEIKTCTPDCDENAFCIRNAVSVYNCTCKPGFSGDGKTCKQINECLDGTHMCHKFANCTKTKLSYNCKCKIPYEGDGLNYCNRVLFCARGFDDCPVIAKCKDIDEPLNGNYFTCICPKGFNFNETARRCHDIDECLSSPCPQGATCKNNQGSFVCECPAGFNYISSTNECRDVDECSLIPDLCKPNGNCKNTPGSFECVCDKGFIWNQDILLCKDEDECMTKKHECNLDSSTCRNLPGSYTCICKAGFKSILGTFPKQCKDTDECLTGENNCCHYANCTNTVGSFTCTCISGWTGDGVTCDQIPSCITLTCGKNAICKEVTETKSPTCFCQSGYQGDPLTGCELISMCKKLGQPCGPGQCQDLPLTYKCICDKGYTFDGRTCIDDDECVSSPCTQNAYCKNIPGGFSCECLQGFTGDGMKQCSPVDRCLTTDSRYKLVCSNNGFCKNNKCFCKDGYVGDGLVCNDKNECIYQPCSFLADCENTPGSFTCKCKLGYAGDGVQCLDINECLNKTNPVCDDQANCINTQGSFSCNCWSGYNEYINGKPPTGLWDTCNDENECATQEKNICDKSSSACKDLEGDYECTPNRGYKWKEPNVEKNKPQSTVAPGKLNSNNKAVVDVDECNDTPIQHRCNEEISVCVNNIGSYSCQCKDGYTNPTTDRIVCNDIDECLQKRCHINADCKNIVGSFTCTCDIKYSGDGFNCTSINLCEDVRFNTCNLTTTNCEFHKETASSNCQCKQGFQPNPENPNNCIDINECDPLRPRHNCNTTVESCNNTFGSFECSCLPGYKRDPISNKCVEINECIEKGGNSACQSKQATCVDLLNDFACKCSPGYRIGDKGCENIDECKENLHNCTFQNSICIDLEGRFACDCMQGYTKTKVNGKEVCRKGASFCKTTKDCVANSHCEPTGMCQADTGYHFKVENGKQLILNGSYIVEDKDECKDGSDPCSGCGIDGLKCQNTPGSFLCLCPSGSQVQQCQCLDACKEDTCHWARKCYVDGISVSCKCRDYTQAAQMGSNMNASVCIKPFGGVPKTYYNVHAYFNDMCQSEDDCSLPEKENGISTARDFNYFGPCKFSPEQVKCEMDVKAKVNKDYFVVCEYPKESRTSIKSLNCNN